MQLVGKVLPATIVSQSGKMVTVSFSLTNIPFTLPQVTIPLFGPQYVRYPMQPGDRGIVIPADTYIGGMSGLGGGVADLTQPSKPERPGLPSDQSYRVAGRRRAGGDGIRAGGCNAARQRQQYHFSPEA
jgi:hypothetical protein